MSAEKNSLLEIIKNTVIFQELDTVALKYISNLCNYKDFTENQIICNSGSLADTFYIVAQGQVKMGIYNENSSCTTLWILNRGDVFGEIGVIDQKPFAFDLIALSRVKLLSINGDHFRNIMDKYPQINRFLLKEICEKLRLVTRRMKTKNASSLEKTAQTLMEVAINLGKSTEEGIALPSLTHQEWGFYAELSRESFTKSISLLRKQGIIKNHDKNQREIIICDLEKLKAITPHEY